MYRVTLNWNIEEVPEEIDAEIISETVAEEPDISDITCYDALAQQLMDQGQ